MKQNGNKKERKQRKYEGFPEKKQETSAVNNAEAEAAREKFQEKLKELLSLSKKEKKYVRVSGNQ